MGSSTASETTINTSTDSANTMLTMVTTTDGEQPDDSFDLMDIPSEMSPPAATSSTGQSSEPILPAVVSSPSSVPPPSSSSLIDYSTSDEKGKLKTGSSLSTDATLRSELSIGCLDIRASSVSNLLDETDAPPVDATPIIIHGAVNDAGKVSVSGRTPPLPDLRATDFFSTPVRGSVDAGQPETNDVNSTLTLIVGRARGEEGNRENRENRVANNIDEKKYGDGKPNVNVTTNPLDISLIGARTDRSNNGQSSDGPGRTSATNKPRGKPAGKSKLSSSTIILIRCCFIFLINLAFRRCI
ncbi:uncharacterized protein LOC122538165 isoform X2 [Frieseomelitta varia]|uniref:uncharacterized protein LOC122538165 isoform X2 n=1 Tax=Frieseomelitta varia TaxID=561572 RepID=UPI001CB69FB3|nr:uncharacterized protein LOC122538165 isoform X2 [Frieseomelitta varia]